VRLALRAVDDAKQHDALDAIARAYMTLDAAHIDLGEVERAVHTVEALEILEQLGDLPGQARALSNLGVEAYYEGRWIEAASFYERSAQASHRTGDVVQSALSTSNLAEIFVNQGRLDEATQAVADASRVFRAAKFLDGLAFASILEGRIALARGNFDRASELFAAAKQEYIESDAKGAVLECETHEAACALAAGRAGEALERADAALAFEASHAGAAAFTPELLRVRGGALARLGRLDDAREALQAGCNVARERGLVYDEVLVLATWAALLPDDGRAPTDADLATLGIERVPVMLTPAG
jgi:tetratricopeptide (TPR) repeat protein